MKQKSSNPGAILGKVKSYTFKSLNTKVGRDGTRRISGYANASTLDRSNEIVDPEAFKSSLDKYMENPIVFYNHDWDEAIGKVISASINASGLLVDIEIGSGFEPADSVWAQIEQGILKSFSIGFRPLLVEVDEYNEALVIKDMELYEVSVVTIPMNRESLFEITSNQLKGVKIMDEDNYVTYKSLVKKTEEEADKVEQEKKTAVAKEIEDATEIINKLNADIEAIKANHEFETEALKAAYEFEKAHLLDDITKNEEMIASYKAQIDKINEEIEQYKIKTLIEAYDLPNLLKNIVL